MKTTPITITVDGQSVSLFAKKLGYRKVMELGGILRKGLPPPVQALSDDGQPLVNEKGEKVFAEQSIPLANIGDYQVTLLQTSLCNEAGKPFYTADDIDAWDAEDIRTACKTLDDLNKTTANAVEVERGNSAATANADSSSS